MTKQGRSFFPPGNLRLRQLFRTKITGYSVTNFSKVVTKMLQRKNVRPVTAVSKVTPISCYKRVAVPKDDPVGDVLTIVALCVLMVLAFIVAALYS